MPIHGILAAPSPPFIDDTKVSRGQSPTRTDISFYVLVALVDTMRLHGIQSSDPVALTSFSSIIRSEAKRRFQRSPVAEHFHLQNHDFNSHVSLCCIDHDAQWSDDTRKARESYWIRRLNTMQPHGINKGD